MMRTHFWRRKKEIEAWVAIVRAKSVGIDKSQLPLQKCKLTFVRSSSREPDYDGLISSFKMVVDALVRSGILIDDTYTVTGKWDVSWEKGPPKKGKIFCKVETYD